jgi:Spy/CpxP family protein refolding chaperone
MPQALKPSKLVRPRVLSLAWCAATLLTGLAFVEAGAASPSPTLVSIAINPSTASVSPANTKQFHGGGNLQRQQHAKYNDLVSLELFGTPSCFD